MGHKTAFNDPYQLVTNIILGHLERGVVPWRCPWQREVCRPKNFLTGRDYQGINTLLLGQQRFASPWWLTFRQAQERGGSVRKGEHGSLIIKYGRHERVEKNGDGTEDERKIYFLRCYYVFNAVQIDGILFPEPEAATRFDANQRIQRAETIVHDMPNPPKIKEGRTVQASYKPGTDTVNMPSLARFEQVEAYYLTLFHELIHSTGHATRLNRKAVTDSKGFASQMYSQEELVAEMGASFLGMETEIVCDQHEQSAAYLKNWLDVLKQKDHYRWIVQAAALAGRAADYVLNRQIPDIESSVETNPQQEATAMAFSAA